MMKKAIYRSLIKIPGSFMFFFILHGYILATPANSDDLSDSNKLNSVKQIIEAIKKDDSNSSYTSMIDHLVMPQHSLSHRHVSSAYFYTDNRLLISDIISMVVERPQGIIRRPDGIIGIYRDFDFKRDLSSLFVKEKRIAGSYDGYHLGTTSHGPTNRVVVFLRTNNPSKMNTAQFIEAYPQSK